MRAARIAAAVAILTLCLAAAACTSPQADDQVASAAGAAPTTGAAAGAGAGAGGSATAARGPLAWARCMREHGVDVPDPDAATGQFPGFDKGAAAARDRAGWDRAVAACTSTEAGGDRDHSPLSRAELARMRQWAECMRDHQVPVPDPDPNDPFGPHFERLPNMPAGAVIDAALEACQDKLPARVRETG